MRTTKEFLELARNNNVCIERKHIITYLKVHGTQDSLNIFTQFDLLTDDINYEDIKKVIYPIACKQ